nr:hypothetical protein [uncultured Capnocytophaga sp.]
MKIVNIFICIFAVLMLLLCLGVVIYSTFINYTLWYIPVISSIPLVVALLFVLNHYFDFSGDTTDADKNRITYDDKGFTIDIPLFDETNFIAWDSIKKIIYSDAPEEERMFVVYLTRPLVATLKEHPHWINKYTFKSSNSKPIMEVRIKASTIGFRDFAKEISEYLDNVQIPNMDRRRNGVLVNRTEKNTAHTREITELWKAQEWEGTQVVYRDERY